MPRAQTAFEVLIADIANSHGVSRRKARSIVSAITSYIREQLAQVNSIKIPELGTFRIHHRKAGKRFNIKYRQLENVGQQSRIAFSAALKLRKKIASLSPRE